MRKFAALVLAFVSLSAFADDAEHLAHLRMMMHAMSQHGAVIPQPEAIASLATVAINIKAQCFAFTPPTFTVNQGDVVTLSVNVPSNDCSPVGHGLRMETYFDPGFNVGRGKTVTQTFTATTTGTFAFVCTQSTCGTGHTSMIGQMIVRQQATLAISSISPNSGSTSGGTNVTITGTNFQSGATVTFGARQATNVNVVNSTTITATTPLGPASEELQVDVTVTNPDNTSFTLHPGFNYTPAPLQVMSIVPNVIATGGGTVVTITGTGFTNAVASTVTFGGVAGTDLRVLDPVTLQVTAPPHAAGTVDVAVTIGANTVVKPGAVTYAKPAPRHRSVKH